MAHYSEKQSSAWYVGHLYRHDSSNDGHRTFDIYGYQNEYYTCCVACNDLPEKGDSPVYLCDLYEYEQEYGSYMHCDGCGQEIGPWGSMYFLACDDIS